MNFYTKLFFVLVAVYLINASQSFASTSYDPWVYFNCKATKGSVSVNFDFKKNKNDGSIKFIHGTTGIVDTYNSAEIGVEPDKNQRIRANSQSMDYFDFSWSKNLPSQDWQDKIRVNFDLTINKRRITTVVSTLQTVTFGPKKETLDAGRYRGECSITENTSSEVLESSASFGQMNYNCKVEETLSGIQYPKSFNIEVRNNRIKSFKFVGDTKAVKISKIQKTSISDKGTRILWNTRNANFNINHNLEIEASGLFRIGSIHQGHVHEHIAKGKCFCGRSDGCAIKAKVKQPKNSSNKQAFNSFDANGRISIQKALTDLKFYNSSIDGSYGPGTDKAIEKYLKNNGISGSTKKSVLTALKKLIAEQVQSDELAIVKSEQSSKDTLLAAQLIIKDVEEFLKSGSGSFDLEFAKKYSAIRKVSKGQWNSILDLKFTDFKSYVFANEVFQKYSEDQKNKREAEFKAILKNNRQQLTDLTESLRIWLQANLIHEKADDVYDQVAASEKTLEGNDLQEIQQTIMKADKLANSLNLKQKTLSVDATQKAKMEINEAAFNSFDANGRISIQKALSDFGLFKLEIDGVFGPGINIAITEYLKTKGITEITSSDAVIEQLKILVSATLDSNALAVVRSEMSAEEEYLAAVVVMQDIETFLSEKIGSFGLDFIRKYGPARGVSKGFWSDEKRASFLALKEYVFANEDFRNYANNQKLEREQALLNEISSAKDKLTEHLGLLRLWLEANLIDERAEEIFETVSNIEKALEGKALNNLLKILEVTTRTVKDLNLINNVTKSVKTDSKYELDAIYMFVNLSGFANHVFKNLDGVLELEGGNANICQIGDIDDWDQFAAFQKLNKLVDIEKSTLKFNCGQSEDFYILAGTSLASGTLPNIVANTDLSDLYLLSKDEIVDLKRRFQYKSEANYEDVLAGVKNGYGLFYIAGHPPIICSSEDDNIDAHLQLINEKQDIIRYFAPKSEKIDFNLSLSTINKRLQKKTCGMIYGSSRDLKILADASINTNKYEVEFLPIWFSDQKVNEAIQFQKNRQALNNSKELDAEQQRILKEEKLKKLRESAENRQRELRALNDVKFTSIIDRLQVGVREIVNEIFEDQADNNVVNSNYEVNEELLELMSPIQFDLLNKKLEGWEPVSTAINKVDFGTIIFNNRKPEAIIVELEINMKNRKIGKFDPYCKRIHIAYDLDFDMWRREIFSDCATEARTNRWKLKNDFESGWIVKVE